MSKMEQLLKRANLEVDGMDEDGGHRGQKTGRMNQGSKGGKGVQAAAGEASRSSRPGRTVRPSPARQEINGEEFEIKTNDPGLKKLLSVMLKQQLKTCQDMRKVKHSVFDAFHCRIDHPLIKAIQKEREMYVQYQQASDRDSQLEYGPGIPMFNELLRQLATQEVGAANRVKITKLIEQFNTEENLEETISGVYLEKMKEATMIRVLIGMQHFGQRKFIVQSMKQLEFKHLLGCPPPGYMENQLSAALENISL
jgi:hypothetical protein